MLMPPGRLSAPERRRLRRELVEGEAPGPFARLMRQTAQALSLLTGELGVAMVPRLDDAVVEKLEMIALSGETVLLVLQLGNGVVRTVYAHLRASLPAQALASVTPVLNERLAGRRLREIRATLPERLRDALPGEDPAAEELLNIFLQSAGDLLQLPDGGEGEVHLGRASVLASQPEFASESSLKGLIELTERRDLLAEALSGRPQEGPTVQITIGAENPRPELTPFTLVTSSYRAGNLSGVLGVIGPTRMPYEKVTAIVESASTLLSELLTA
jgi:heat-inducible transcriptional repressor